MVDDQTFSILIGILFFIILAVVRFNRGIGWG